MRVQIRAPDQNDNNTKAGGDLLRTAEGALQSQLNIMRQIKEKVIDAANDTNTDQDRVTIQKQIDQLYEQIDDITHSTRYNGIQLLTGGIPYKKYVEWIQLDEPQFIYGSGNLGLISAETTVAGENPNDYSMSGIYGNFKIFKEYGVTSTTSSTLEFPSIYSGAVTNKWSISATANAPREIAERCVVANNTYYIFTHHDSPDYLNALSNAMSGRNYQVIPITSVQSAYEQLRSISGLNVESIGTDPDNSSQIKFLSNDEFTTWSGSSLVNGCGITWGEYSAGGNYVPPTPATEYSSGSSGRAAHDAKTYTGNLSSKANWTGFTVDGTEYVFSDEVSTYEIDTTNAVTRYLVNPNYSGTISVPSGSMTVNGNNVTIVGTYIGNDYWDHQVLDGYRMVGETTIKPEGEKASTTIDLSGLDTTDSTTLESFIDDMVNKRIQWVTKYNNKNSQGDITSSYITTEGIEFIDTKVQDSYNSIPKYAQTYTYTTDTNRTGESTYNGVIDLNDLRTAVSGGQTIAETFAGLVVNKATELSTNYDTQYFEKADNLVSFDGANLKFTAPEGGERYNNYQVYIQDLSLRHRTIDFKTWHELNPDISIPDDLANKGFQVYCASHTGQWFNFVFRTGDTEDMPETRSDGSFYSINIDISGCTDVDSLVQALYDQGSEQLKALDPEDGRDGHFMFLTAPEDGKIVLFDERFQYSYNISNYQTYGAKIADGVYDDVIKIEKQLYAKQLIIQDTEKSNSCIAIHIPQMTLDHIFYTIQEPKTIKDYPVTSKDAIEELLGQGRDQTKSDPRGTSTCGIIDRGINYILDAMTEVGAQMQRLELSNSNIVTKRENAQASESTIRNIDMAKEMIEQTKLNILANASQAMLAQSNQNLSNVLELIQ